MPNWCSTDYHIYGSKKSIDKLTDLLNKTWKTEGQWVGHVVEELTGKECQIYARGFMLDAPNRSSDEQVDIYLDTAWCELSEWRHFIESQFNDVHIEFLATEPGCGLFQSNMETYIGKYLIDDTPNGNYDFYDEEDAINYINETYNQQFTTIDQVMEFSGDDNEVYINQIEETE